jgi:hypothetical protein
VPRSGFKLWVLGFSFDSRLMTIFVYLVCFVVQ